MKIDIEKIISVNETDVPCGIIYYGTKKHPNYMSKFFEIKTDMCRVRLPETQHNNFGLCFDTYAKESAHKQISHNITNMILSSIKKYSNISYNNSLNFLDKVKVFFYKLFRKQYRKYISRDQFLYKLREISNVDRINSNIRCILVGINTYSIISNLEFFQIASPNDQSISTGSNIIHNAGKLYGIDVIIDYSLPYDDSSVVIIKDKNMDNINNRSIPHNRGSHFIIKPDPDLINSITLDNGDIECTARYSLVNCGDDDEICENYEKFYIN